MRGVLLVSSCLLHACVDRLPTFPCTDSAQCTRDGDQGTCERSGFCSFDDADCTTGRRYGEGAPPDLRNACVIGTTSGRVGAWSAGPDLPIDPLAHAHASAANRLYVLGGFVSDVAVAAVWTAAIGTDGTVGTWSPATALPAGRGSATAVTANGRLYVLGGRIGSGANKPPTAEVWFAVLQADGTPGAWIPTRPLPVPRYAFTAVAVNGRIYIFGGMQGTQGPFTLTDTSWVADIGPDGQLGAWTAVTTLPQPRRGIAAVATPGHLYLLGGCADSGSSCSTALTDVLVAPIGADGSLGAWTPTTSLTGPRRDHGAVVHDGFVYVLGGSSGNTSAGWLADVASAPIQPDGGLGAWVPTTPFPAVQRRPGIAVYDDRIYAVQGSTTDTLSAPLLAP